MSFQPIYPYYNQDYQQPQLQLPVYQYVDNNKLPSINLPYPFPQHQQQQATTPTHLAPSSSPSLQTGDYHHQQPQYNQYNHFLHPQMHYDTQHPVLPHLYNYSQQQPKTYPISPASLPASLNDKESSSSPEKLPIDYSSIVSYTISPSLKRRRRSTKSNSKDIGDMQYSCSQCSKVFQKAYNLKSHMKTHSTEKPFKCSICSKAFARSHDKKRHELLHAGKKNFKCEGFLKDGKTRWGCGKKFARSDALSRHFRTETGWLCIKPLMDEAKTLDAQKIPKTEEFYDNSNFIRRLIQK